MKVCTKCGRDVQDVDKFCPKCGNTRFTDKSVRAPMHNCQICSNTTDYLWTCAKCGKQICRNCTKTSGYLDILCTECSKAESEPKAPEPEPVEPEIEALDEPEEEEGLLARIIAWFKNLFAKKEPMEEVKTTVLQPPSSGSEPPAQDAPAEDKEPRNP